MASQAGSVGQLHVSGLRRLRARPALYVRRSSQRFGAVIRLRPACSYVESNQGEVIGSNQRIFLSPELQRTCTWCRRLGRLHARRRCLGAVRSSSLQAIRSDGFESRCLQQRIPTSDDLDDLDHLRGQVLVGALAGAGWRAVHRSVSRR